MLPRLPLVFWLFKTLIGIIIFLLIDIVLDKAQILSLIFVLILFSNLGDIDSNSQMTLSLVAFIFFRGLSLKLTCISGKEILGRLILISIFPIILIGFVFILSLQPFGYLKSIFFIPKDSQKLIFASISTIFSTTYSYKSGSHSRLSNQAWIDKRSSLQKYCIKISSLRAIV